MKRLPARALRTLDLTGDGSFVRGFVATGLLAAFQDAARPADAKQLKRVLRHALQGGTALTAGGLAVAAIQRRDLAGAVLATAAGAAGVLIIENLLRERAATNQE